MAYFTKMAHFCHFCFLLLGGIDKNNLTFPAKLFILMGVTALFGMIFFAQNVGSRNWDSVSLLV